MNATRSMPLARKAASAQSRMRRPPTSAKHLGVSAVVGIRRWPRPAPMMIACMVILRFRVVRSRVAPRVRDAGLVAPDAGRVGGARAAAPLLVRLPARRLEVWLLAAARADV